jgi:ATP-dependent DNA ligase
LEQKFAAIAKAVSKLKLRFTVLYGEIVAVVENGIPRFRLLQGFQNNQLRQPYIMFLMYFWTDARM